MVLHKEIIATATVACGVKSVETILLYRGDIPVCTGGIGDVPPEDAGGLYGFEQLVRVMADPHSPDYSSTEEWAHDQFFEHLSVTAVNRCVRVWRSGKVIHEWDGRNGGDEL